jgi:UPF0755 protein
MKTRTVVLIVLLGICATVATACSVDSASSVYLEANRDRLSVAASAQKKPVPFVVAPGTPAKTIAQDLQAAGLINDALLFEAYVRAQGLSSKLEAGTHMLSPDMTIPEIADVLQNALAPSITVTVRPGWRLEQTADVLNKSNANSGDAYRQAATAADLSGLTPEDRKRFSFLQFLPAGQSLEGYLYPDSYELPREGATAADLLKRQLDEFEAKVMPVYWEAVAQDPATPDLHQVLTLASIVEREAVLDEERPTIAGVYLNRLARGMRLEADPTVQYAMGFQPASGQWWKTPVFLEEYSQVDSPYNTYLYTGLPPGPIAAPRLASIRAVLNPEQHDYLYFVAEPGGSGRHIFSRTFEEHLENVKRYQNQ